MNPKKASKTYPYTLSIVIPAYNEMKRIRPTLEAIDRYISNQNFSCEVILVDDGSQDQTASFIRNFIQGKNHYRLIQNDQNRGKGYSVRTGLLMATGQYRLFSDADLSTPLEDVEKLMAHMPAYDVAIGSRRVKGAQLLKRQPVYRELSGRIFSSLVWGLLFPGYLDTQCGFKLFKADAVYKIFPKQQINGFGFDVEILYIALKKCGLKVKEVPVRWMDSPLTHVRLMQDSIQMFGDLFKVKQYDRKGFYDPE